MIDALLIDISRDKLIIIFIKISNHILFYFKPNILD